MRIKDERKDLLEYWLLNSNRMQQKMEELIWDYIDGRCSAAERDIISGHLAEDPEWKIKYDELLSIHALLLEEQLDMPSLRFTKNVMEEIGRFKVAPATRDYVNKNVIRGIMSFFLIMIVGLFIYFIGQVHWNSSSTGNIPYLPDVNKLNWSRMLNNTYVNIFVGINVILSLILIDKYMQGKKNADQNGHWSKGDSA
jgi:hypothetical protein